MEGPVCVRGNPGCRMACIVNTTASKLHFIADLAFCSSNTERRAVVCFNHLPTKLKMAYIRHTFDTVSHPCTWLVVVCTDSTVALFLLMHGWKCWQPFQVASLFHPMYWGLVFYTSHTQWGQEDGLFLFPGKLYYKGELDWHWGVVFLSLCHEVKIYYIQNVSWYFMSGVWTQLWKYVHW